MRLLFQFCLLFLSLSFGITSYGQESSGGMDNYKHNLKSFPTSQANISAAKKYNQGYEQHPEFGLIPRNFNTSQNVVELLSERTINSRKFINLDNPKEFHIQTFYKPAHIFKNGYWHSLNHRLEKTNDNGIYISKRHHDYKVLNTNEGFTIIGEGDEAIQFNNWILETKNINNNKTIYKAKWDKLSVGEEGTYIKNIFPGIDGEIIFELNGRVTTNFIIQNWELGDAVSLKFQDKFNIPNATWSLTSSDSMVTDILLEKAGKTLLEIKEAVAYPLYSSNKDDKFFIAYKRNQNNIIMEISAEKVKEVLYQGSPLVIDPIVTGTNTLAQANVLGSMYNSSCNFTNSCDYDLTVTFPPHATITNTTADFSYVAQGACVLSDGSMRFTTGSCVSPDQTGFYWFCNDPFSAGTCNGTNIAIYDHISNCLPDPACVAQDVEFTLQFFRTCYGQTGCANDCIGANADFSVTITGHTVEFNDFLNSTIIADTTEICVGESIEVYTWGQYGVPDYNFTWSEDANGTQVFSTLQTAVITYTDPGDQYLYVIIEDDCGQTITDSILIIVHPLEIPEFSMANRACIGDAVTLPTTSDNNVTGTWSPSTVNTQTPGTYNFTFTPDPSYTCSDIFEFTLQVDPSPTVDLGPDLLLCHGETAVLNPNLSNMDYLWSDNSTGSTLTVTQAGTYYVTASVGGNCVTSDTVVVEYVPELTSQENHFTCYEDLPFSWYGQNIHDAGLNVATHVFQSVDGCDSIVSLNLSIPPAPKELTIRERGCESHDFEGTIYNTSTTVNDTLYTASGCDSVYRTIHIIIEENDPYYITEIEEHCNSYFYNGINFTNDTIYVAQVYQSQTGCDSAVLQKDIRIDKFVLSLNAEKTEIYKGEKVHLVTSATENYNVTSWEPYELLPYQNATSQTLVPESTTTYKVNALSRYLCEGSAEITIVVKDLDKTVFVPNAFSPNGDGLNDIFNPLLNITEAYSIAEFSVYNRYGQLVYVNDGQVNRGWDGTYNGKPCEQDVYMWVLKVKFIDGTTFEDKGDVHLIR